MNEFELIEQLTRDLARNQAVVVGAGDDCAVLDLGLPDQLLLFKTDAVVEGVHFLAQTEAEKVGHKALARALSDIAAMAGRPVAAVVTLGLPAGFDAERVQRIYAGMNATARRYGVAIAGGETTTTPHTLLLSVALMGTVERTRCILRSGARPGQAIFVTGALGGSLGGRHLEFEPRLEEGHWLAANFPISAMIDLSDGLAGDLRHLLRASGVGAELLAEAIPISREAKARARSHPSNKSPLMAALTDGEDFELLFTLPSGHAVSLLDAWKKRFPDVGLTCIGKTTAGRELCLRDRQGCRPLGVHGYVHFQQS